jgi:hypothetical protein
MGVFAGPRANHLATYSSAPKRMERTRFIEHGGKRILFLEYTDLGSDLGELLREIEKTKRVIATQPPGSVLTLTDVRRSSITPANVRAMKELVAHNEPYVRWSAVVVGLTGVYLAGFRAIQALSRRRNLLSFGDLDEAKDWLVSQP